MTWTPWWRDASVAATPSWPVAASTWTRPRPLSLRERSRAPERPGQGAVQGQVGHSGDSHTAAVGIVTVC